MVLVTNLAIFIFMIWYGPPTTIVGMIAMVGVFSCITVLLERFFDSF